MAHDTEGSHPHGEKDSKLYLVKSPLVHTASVASLPALGATESQGDIERFGFRDDAPDCPEFEKHEEATNIELFFDLFFAANLTVFSEVHDVTNLAQLRSYMGYFCMLWFTWALVGLFDVRFVTDSIFERVARALHLGVMVGFAVVAANFDPEEQVRATFRAMSLILMVSRLTLSVQYSVLIWHVRKYKKTHLPLALMAGINFVAGLVYLGITFAFKDTNTKTYIAWYILGGIEVLATAILSLFWKVLSFERTHLTNRMCLLTFIIIGEGIIVVCTNITLIVKNANAWTPPTVGVVTAGIATLYIVYMIYFDWMRHIHLPRFRQLIWASLHFPFHLALTLFVEGSAQFVIWYKIQEVVNDFATLLNNALNDLFDTSTNVQSQTLVNTINETVLQIFDLYPPKFQDTVVAIDDALKELASIPDSVFSSNVSSNNPLLANITEATNSIVTAVLNSLLASFDVEGFEEAGKSDFDGSEAELQTEVLQNDLNRFQTVFYYAFIAAGIVLFLMNVLFIVSRTKKFTPFNYVRTGLNMLLALGLCLVTLLGVNEAAMDTYDGTPWILPTICLTFFVVLIINHLPHPSRFWARSRGRHNDEGTAFLGEHSRKRNDEASAKAPIYHVTQSYHHNAPNQDNATGYDNATAYPNPAAYHNATAYNNNNSSYHNAVAYNSDTSYQSDPSYQAVPWTGQPGTAT